MFNLSVLLLLLMFAFAGIPAFMMPHSVQEENESWEMFKNLKRSKTEHEA